jgi:hypothetical protein
VGGRVIQRYVCPRIGLFSIDPFFPSHSQTEVLTTRGGYRRCPRVGLDDSAASPGMDIQHTPPATFHSRGVRFRETHSRAAHSSSWMKTVVGSAPCTSNTTQPAGTFLACCGWLRSTYRRRVAAVSDVQVPPLTAFSLFVIIFITLYTADIDPITTVYCSFYTERTLSTGPPPRAGFGAPSAVFGHRKRSTWWINTSGDAHTSSTRSIRLLSNASTSATSSANTRTAICVGVAGLAALAVYHTTLVGTPPDRNRCATESEAMRVRCCSCGESGRK